MTLLFVIIGLVCLSPRDAFAYTDPGTGALLVQALLAGLLGVLFYFRRITWWLKERKWFKGKKKDVSE